MQETTFPIEILIHDDASTDGTTDLIKAYEATYPDLIKAIYQTDNQYSRGKKITPILLKQARGKYIALCEGDDYWTDPNKLQKQIDFLEANPEVSICFTRANLMRDQQLELHAIPDPFQQEKFQYIELLKHYNFIATASVCFRKPINFNLPKWFLNIPFGDLGLYKIISNNGFIQCLDQITTVYRIHEHGIYSGNNQLTNLKRYASFYQSIFKHLNLEEQKVVKNKLKNIGYIISKQTYPRSKIKRKVFFVWYSLKNNYLL